MYPLTQNECPMIIKREKFKIVALFPKSGNNKFLRNKQLVIFKKQIDITSYKTKHKLPFDIYIFI